MVFIDIGIIILFLVGLFSYVFNKKTLPSMFWRYFFWINIVYVVLGTIYSIAPNHEITKYLSYLRSVDIESSGVLVDVITLVLTVPLFYVTYELSKGQFRQALKNRKATLSKKSTTRSKFNTLGFIGGFLFLVLVCVLSLNAYTSSPTSKDTTKVSQSSLSEKELFKLINKKRVENNVQALGYEKSTCVLAKKRVEEINEKGLGVFDDLAAFQRAVDKVYEDNTIIIEETPDWYSEFITYQETAADAIQYWSEYETNSLFTEKNYQFGCVAEKNGFAIVIVGFNEEKQSGDAINTESDTYPQPQETNESGIL